MEKTAIEFKKDFLGKIPLHNDLRIAEEKITPLTFSNPEHEISKKFIEIAKKLNRLFLNNFFKVPRL